MYSSNLYKAKADYRFYAIKTDIIQDFLRTYENREFGLFLRVWTPIRINYFSRFDNDCILTKEEAKLLRNNESFTSKDLQHFSIKRFIDEGFLENFLLNQELPKVNELRRFQLVSPDSSLIIKLFDLLTQENMCKLSYSFPNLNTVGFNLFNFYDEYHEYLTKTEGKSEIQLKCKLVLKWTSI